MNVKEQIVNAIENCDDEQLRNRMYIRLARRYCAVNRVTNIVNDDGTVEHPTLPSVGDMVKSLDDRRCYKILTSSAFKTYFEEYGETMKCCECYECAGLDCPVICQREADDIAAYAQMEATASIEDEDMNRYIVTDDDIIDEESEYGGGAFSSIDDYYAYKFDPNY